MEDPNKEKIQKLTRVLKELEEKYKKIHKDRTSLLICLKQILPQSSEAATQLEAPPGQIDSEKLGGLYRVLEAEKVKEGQELIEAKKKLQTAEAENATLKEHENVLKLKIEQETARANKLETEMQNQAKKQANEGANLLLTKLKSVGLPNPPPLLIKSNSAKDVQALEAKIREQADLILSLKSQLTELQAVTPKTTVSPVKTSAQDFAIQTEPFLLTSAAPFNIDSVSENESLRKQLLDLQTEFTVFIFFFIRFLWFQFAVLATKTSH